MCNGQEVAIADYFELYTVIGSLAECQSKNEGMFKLPDLRGRFLEGANGNLGNKIEAGLPNITAGFEAYTYQSGSPSGKIKSRITNTNQVQSGGGGDRTYVTFNLDASRDSNVYGKSDTVQPNSVCVNYIIKY